MKPVAGSVEKRTWVAAVNPVPVIVTDVPPPVVPEAGAQPGDRRSRREVGVAGRGRRAAVAGSVADVDVHRPGSPAGVTAVIEVSELTVKLAAGVVR